MSQLNLRQQEAVHYTQGPLLVLAGAGSGKTSVITRKIAHLVEKCNVRASHIFAVTFTNKAAREMKERVSSLLKAPKNRGLNISTFHTLGLNIIRKEHLLLGYKPGFSIFDDSDVRTLLNDIIAKESSTEETIDDIKHAISHWKNDLILPDHALSHAKDDREQTMAVIYQHYQRTLKTYNAVDFDDLILVPVILLKNNTEALERWQNRVRYLLVDEYQDTNTSQYLLVKLLVGLRNQFTVVGDDDQSIYAWRGARPEHIGHLKDDYPSLKVIMLEQNYRSTGRILKCANSLITNNPHVFEKKLWSDMSFGDEVRIIRCKNEDSECERVALEILTNHLRTNRPYSDFAILYRGNYQAKIMEFKLQQHKIPYYLSGGTSFFARQEIKDTMSYFRLLVNPDDDNAFLRVINTPRRDIGSSTLEKLANYANDRSISLYKACSELGLKEFLSSRFTDRLEKFTQWMDVIRQQCSENNPIEAIQQMISDTGYEHWIRENASKESIANARINNIGFLVESLKNTLERDELEPLTIEDAISRLVLRDMLERQQEDKDSAESVQMLTLHASKGLEFSQVFIIGMEEDILPHRSSVENNTIEEERRLAYVGITRAKQNLTCTFAAKRKQYGNIISCLPSRFLSELPQDELQWNGLEEAAPEVKAARGNEALQSLKSMLKT
ncbi:UNVERIFIED_CONTAM: hypothetical protein GTU68_060384 [Idotea baltica]|nr:hypothetical protein [Idotea baltica]